jgi:hypothetical protein
MSAEKIWNEESRDKLREGFQSTILVELRLAKRGRRDILRTCRDSIEDGCPDSEVDTFLQFAAGELGRIAAKRIRNAGRDRLRSA